MRRLLRPLLFVVLAAVSLTPVQGAAAQDREAGRFTLDVKKSGFLNPGSSHIETTSAVATYTAEFMRGRVKALKVQMFVPRLSADARARLAANDNDASRDVTQRRVVLVLLVDDQRRVTEASLTYSSGRHATVRATVVPGIE